MDEQRTFVSERNVKYILRNSKSNYLAVVFSAFSPIGKPPRYNFYKAIEGIDCNQLFILDDFGATNGIRATYYISRDLSIERSVIELINHVIETLQIPFENVITCGSSKGGYSALYYAIKYGFGYAIAGTPQFYLGKYLMEQTNCKDIAKFISGGYDDKEYLNGVLEDTVRQSPHKPNILIHAGEKEDHYKNHVMPFIHTLIQSNKTYSLNLGNYEKHSDLATYFPPYLIKQLTNIVCK